MPRHGARAGGGRTGRGRCARSHRRPDRRGRRDARRRRRGREGQQLRMGGKRRARPGAAGVHPPAEPGAGRCEKGLRKVLEQGGRRCDEVLSEGRDVLDRGLRVAAALGLLADEFTAAIDNCRPKVFITPPSASVETGKGVAFTARSNEGDSDFTWTTTAGAIDPSTGNSPLPTPRVRSPSPPPRAASWAARRSPSPAPPGRSSSRASARRSASPSARPSAVLTPGGSRQLTALVANTANQAVTWTASGGGVTATGGLYTAPQTPGDYTVTATSKQDPTKTGTATVTVIGAVVSVYNAPGRQGPCLRGHQGAPGRSARDRAVERHGGRSCNGGGGTASQTSDVEASATGTSWLTFHATSLRPARAASAGAAAPTTG